MLAAHAELILLQIKAFLYYRYYAYIANPVTFYITTVTIHIITYRTRQIIRGGKLSRLDAEFTIR